MNADTVINDETIISLMEATGKFTLRHGDGKHLFFDVENNIDNEICIPYTTTIGGLISHLLESTERYHQQKGKEDAQRKIRMALGIQDN